MAQTTIFGPFLAMLLLTILVWVVMFARRIPFLNSHDIDPDEITPARLAEISPPSVANASDNLKNLFEVPVLFYAMCLYLHGTAQVDAIYLIAAWMFVVFRALHSAVHCTVNRVMVRFALYALSSIACFFMIIRALAAMLGG